MIPPERVLGWFQTPEEAYETADRALVSRLLRTGQSFVLNEPQHTDRYIREEAAKLREKLRTSQEEDNTRQQPVYWFLYQDDHRFDEPIEFFDDIDMATLVDDIDMAILVDDIDLQLLDEIL
jgi:hypothetical protein